MKKKMYALSGIFMIVLVISGLWATKAINLSVAQQTIQTPTATSLGSVMSMQQMAQGAEVIVIGKCVGTRSEWINRSLVTRATVLVAETLKGEAAGTVDVVLPGGIDSNRKFPVAMTYAGAPTMSQDDEVALFLINHGEVANGYSVMGFSEGKFSIVKDNEGEKAVTRDMTRVPVQMGPGPTRGNPQGIRLPEFKAMVQKYLN